MTLQDLTHLFELKNDLIEAEELLQHLITQAQPKAQKLTGMPHVGGIRDQVGDLAIEIADMQDEIKNLKSQIEAEEIPVREYIKTIRDGRVRTAFRLRYLRGLQWKEVSKCMGANYSPDKIKVMCYRQLLE